VAPPTPLGPPGEMDPPAQRPLQKGMLGHTRTEQGPWFGMATSWWEARWPCSAGHRRCPPWNQHSSCQSCPEHRAQLALPRDVGPAPIRGRPLAHPPITPCACTPTCAQRPPTPGPSRLQWPLIMTSRPTLCRPCTNLKHRTLARPTFASDHDVSLAFLEHTSSSSCTPVSSHVAGPTEQDRALLHGLAVRMDGSDAHARWRVETATRDGGNVRRNDEGGSGNRSKGS